MHTRLSSPLRRILPGLALLLLAGAVTLSAAAGDKAPAPKVTSAIAVIEPTAGNQAKGVLRFTKTDDGIRIRGEISGLPPGKHGFHVHEFGDTSAPDGTSAGGHFNPEGEMHGAPSDQARHVGDLGNITAGEDGTAKVDMVDQKIALNGPHSILGRALVVHAGVDDLKSQPTGDAGGRIGIGVVAVAQ